MPSHMTVPHIDPSLILKSKAQTPPLPTPPQGGQPDFTLLCMALWFLEVAGTAATYLGLLLPSESNTPCLLISYLS